MCMSCCIVFSVQPKPILHRYSCSGGGWLPMTPSVHSMRCILPCMHACVNATTCAHHTTIGVPIKLLLQLLLLALLLAGTTTNAPTNQRTNVGSIGVVFGVWDRTIPLFIVVLVVMNIEHRIDSFLSLGVPHSLCIRLFCIFARPPHLAAPLDGLSRCCTSSAPSGMTVSFSVFENTTRSFPFPFAFRFIGQSRPRRLWQSCCWFRCRLPDRCRRCLRIRHRDRRFRSST